MERIIDPWAFSDKWMGRSWTGKLDAQSLDIFDMLCDSTANIRVLPRYT